MLLTYLLCIFVTLLGLGLVWALREIHHLWGTISSLIDRVSGFSEVQSELLGRSHQIASMQVTDRERIALIIHRMEQCCKDKEMV